MFDMHGIQGKSGGEAGLVTARLILYGPKKQTCPDCKRLGDTRRSWMSTREG